MADVYNFIPAFFFKVVFSGLEESDMESRFQEVSGIGVEIPVEKVEEGGLNRYAHQLPKRAEHSNLVLKRALSATSSVITQWAEDAIYNFEFKSCQIIVSLLKTTKNKEFEPVKSWVFEGAYPVKLQYSDLNARDNVLVIETLELAYKYSRSTSLKK